MRRRALASLLSLVFAAGGCGGGPETRTVLADYSNDEFASAYFAFFPSRVQVHPGDTVVVRQTWTGEPHTVTMGKLVEPLGKAMGRYLPVYYEKGFAALPREEPKEVRAASEKIPTVFDYEAKQRTVAQNGAQPCYLDTGEPPKDKKTPCEKRSQPAFTGRESFYNSGYIHYAGANGNIFRVPIADDASPGSYYYYCTVHGPLMAGYIDIKPSDEPIPPQETVTRNASREINRFSVPLEKAWAAAKAGRLRVPADERGTKTEAVKGNVAGFEPMPGDPEFEAFANEFVPRNIRARVGQPITWTVFGPHTISFNVPKYFPLFSVGKDGTVVTNPRLDPPAGGAPPLPEPTEDGPPVTRLGGGTYDGTGFWSSGVIESFDQPLQYTVRISRPGTYRFACLVHPPMVGTITITR